MRKNLGILFLFIFIFTACGAPATNTPEPTKVIVPTLVPTLTPESTKIPSPSEIGLISTHGAGNDSSELNIDDLQVEKSQLIPRDKLLASLNLEGSVLAAYESAIDVWLASHDIKYTTTWYIYNPDAAQWRIIKREAKTANIIGTVGLDEPFNIDVDDTGVVSILDEYEPVIIPHTKDSEPRLLGSQTMILSDPQKKDEVYYYSTVADFLTQEPKVVSGFEDPTLADTKLHLQYRELTYDKYRDLETNDYKQVTLPQLAELEAYIYENSKFSNNDFILYASKIIVTHYYVNVPQINLSGRTLKSIVPRFAVSVPTKYGYVPAIMYELIQKRDGKKEPVVILVSGQFLGGRYVFPDYKNHMYEGNFANLTLAKFQDEQCLTLRLDYPVPISDPIDGYDHELAPENFRPMVKDGITFNLSKTRLFDKESIKLIFFGYDFPPITTCG